VYKAKLQEEALKQDQVLLNLFQWRRYSRISPRKIAGFPDRSHEGGENLYCRRIVESMKPTSCRNHIFKSDQMDSTAFEFAPQALFTPKLA
jgi:hypothetical protein